MSVSKENLREALQQLVRAVDAVTYTDDKGCRYCSFVEDTELDGLDEAMKYAGEMLR